MGEQARKFAHPKAVRQAADIVEAPLPLAIPYVEVRASRTPVARPQTRLLTLASKAETIRYKNVF